MLDLSAHEKDYQTNAWQDYTLQELGNFVHLLVKRADHRIDPVKRSKDLYDAQNYLDMMQEKLNEAKLKV
jgi:hypothetical protein